MPNQKKVSMNLTVNKALSIIDSFSNENYQLTLDEISSYTGIPRSTAFRMLTSLESYGYIKSSVVSNKNLYSLGYAFIEKGFMVQSSLNFRDYARPVMLELRNKLNINVQLSIQDGPDAVYIEQILSFRPIRLYPATGRKVPLYAAACPRILFAFMEEHMQNSLLRQYKFKKFTDNTPVAPNEIKSDLKNIQRDGYSIGHGELVPGTVAIAVPIFYPSTDEVVAALSIIGLEGDFQDDYSYYINTLKKASQKISKNILG